MVYVQPLLFQISAPGMSVSLTVLREKVVHAPTSLEALGVCPRRDLRTAALALERKGLTVHRVAPGGHLAHWRGDTRAVHVRGPFDVYIGRRGNGQDHRPESGWYGKPKGANGKSCGTCAATSRTAADCF